MDAMQVRDRTGRVVRRAQHAVFGRGYALYPGGNQLLADRRPNVVRDNVVERRDLDCFETGVSRFAGTFGEPRRASVQRSAIDVGVKLDRVSVALPERVGKRLGYALRRNVPERLVDSAGCCRFRGTRHDARRTRRPWHLTDERRLYQRRVRMHSGMLTLQCRFAPAAKPVAVERADERPHRLFRDTGGEDLDIDQRRHRHAATLDATTLMASIRAINSCLALAACAIVS